ncbi:MAG: hypothetical protein QXL15_03605 [Candidatus Korarchaeota archaeon]
MVKADIVAQKISEFMNNVPEVEALIATDENGNIIAGKAVTKRDDVAIVKSALETVKVFRGFIQKLTTEDEIPQVISSEGDKIISLILRGNGLYLIAAISPEVKATLGLMKKNLQLLVESLK